MPLSKKKFLNVKINVASMRKRTFFIVVIKTQRCKLIDTCDIKPYIKTG